MTILGQFSDFIMYLLVHVFLATRFCCLGIVKRNSENQRTVTVTPDFFSLQFASVLVEVLPFALTKTLSWIGL